ncbi:flavin reductase [Lachnospiraceae bacterium MD1]|jgi:flavin reductase (DIM6/NTAB) family NADH-FMN oxidoreductase RutF|uniref:Flavin reductase n=1 Tax=Variimorphobacter saccharofermentans TaxID=2755051 RepID=A0A839JXZ7_9FIRM|nr:flavin reductase [Variimorphobacter saccharofermentans]MBB2182543.1 flavin reductase [Variimorphobacter saccharofermentans]
MNNFKEILPVKLRKNPFQIIGKDWMLVTAGNKNGVNTMTASWGGLGVMYGKNVAYVVIRPQRYTKEFIDREETFSLSFLDKQYRKILNYLGTVSGRNENKIEKSGLTVAFSDETPYFGEADYVMICKKLFAQPMSGDSLIDEKLDSTWYSNKDYHVLYIAEITRILQATR